MSRKKEFSRLTKFLQPPNLVDGIFEVSLRLQKFWCVQKIVRTRNGFALTDFFAIQTKFRVVRTRWPQLLKLLVRVKLLLWKLRFLLG